MSEKGQSRKTVLRALKNFEELTHHSTPGDGRYAEGHATLRHADPRVTLTHYGHLIDGSHREAVEKAAAFLDRSGPKIGQSVN